MSGGVHQTFHGPVAIQTQAIATDNAIQNIGHLGSEGASLAEIASLLQQSMELKGREVRRVSKLLKESLPKFRSREKNETRKQCLITTKSYLVAQTRRQTLLLNSLLICRRSLCWSIKQRLLDNIGFALVFCEDVLDADLHYVAPAVEFLDALWE
jgi:hypothetical protein